VERLESLNAVKVKVKVSLDLPAPLTSSDPGLQSAMALFSSLVTDFSIHDASIGTPL
jgi:hypothetical protein